MLRTDFSWLMDAQEHPPQEFLSHHFIHDKAYRLLRDDLWPFIKKHKEKNRYILSPDIQMQWETWWSLWWQIHEMMAVECGGEDQWHEEIQAYTPFISTSQKWVATFSLNRHGFYGKENAYRLETMGGWEHDLFLEFYNAPLKSFKIQGISADSQIRSEKEGGYTSAVHFIAFILPENFIQDFLSHNQDMCINQPSMTENLIYLSSESSIGKIFKTLEIKKPDNTMKYSF
jgi:hypothetical protein